MHSSSPAAQIPIPLPVPVILPSVLHNGAESPATNSSQLVDRYCQDCDIRFYSVKTLKAHKMHYCSSRYAKGSPTSKNSSTPASPTDSQRLSPDPPHQIKSKRSGEQPFLLLRTNPVLIVPYSLLQSASVFTGTSPNFPSQDTPCILMPNGTVQPMSNLVSHLSNDKDLPKNSNYLAKQSSKMGDELSPGKNAKSKAEPTPLDLSVRRSSENSELVIDMEDEKENVFTSSPRREDLCSSSMTNFHESVSSTEKRAEDRKHSECYSGTPSPNSKKSPRRTPNGISTVRSDSAKPKESKKGVDSDYQNSFPSELPVRRNSVGGKFPGPLPLMSSQLPLLLPGVAPELLGQTSLLPLLNHDLRLPGLGGMQGVTESPVPQVFIFIIYLIY